MAAMAQSEDRVSEFLTSSKKHIQKHFDQLIRENDQMHLKNLDDLEAIHANCIDVVKKTLSSKDHNKSIYRALAEINAELKTFITNINYIYDANLETELLAKVSEDICALISEEKKSETLTIPKFYWEKLEDDSLEIKIWKVFNRSKNKLSSFSTVLVNITRKVRSKEKVKIKARKRQIDKQNFLHFHFLLPLKELYLAQWQDQLNEHTRQIHDMHELSNHLITNLMFIPNLGDMNSAEMNDKLDHILNESLTILGFIKDFKDKSNAGIALLNSKFNDELSKLISNIEKKWTYAGTYIESNASYASDKIEKLSLEFSKELDKKHQQWKTHFKGAKEDWKKDLDLSTVLFQIIQIYFNSSNSIAQKINGSIIPAFDDPEKLISETLKNYKFSDSSNSDDSKNSILTESRFQLRKISKESIPEIIDVVTHAQLVKIMSGFISQVRISIDKIPDRFTIFTQLDVLAIPEKTRIDEINLKDLIAEDIFLPIKNDLELKLVDIENLIHRVFRDITEIDQIIEFNIETAFELMAQENENSVIENSITVVVEGLERTQAKIEDIINQFKHIETLANSTLSDMTTRISQEIQELRDHSKIIDLRMRITKANAQERVRKVRKASLQKLMHVLPIFWKSLVRVSQKIISPIRHIQKISGLGPLNQNVEQLLSEYIQEIKKQIKSLPYIYQRLFRIEPLSDERFLEGRHAEFEFVRKDFSGWMNGQYGVTALVGEKGSGKTTFVNMISNNILNSLPITQINMTGFKISNEQELFDLLKDKLNLEEAKNLEDIEESFEKAETKRVIIVEDIQNLFLRTVTGFSALERFLLLTLQSNQYVYWFISCSSYSWSYFDKVIRISKYFQDIIRLENLLLSDVEKIVLKRHRVSGLKLEFEIAANMESNSKFAKMSDDAKYDFLKEKYFEKLFDYSEGNISIINMMWLSSVKKVDKDTVLISHVFDQDLSFLNQLHNDELFTLGAFIQHDFLAVEEHALIFRQDTMESRLLLNRMANRGILHENSEEKFSINFLLYRAILNTLIRKNIIH